MDMRWDLTPLYESFDSREFKDDYTKIDMLLQKCGDAMDAAKECDAPALKSALLAQQQLMELLYRVYPFVSLNISVDARNPEALTYHDRLNAKMAAVQTLTARFMKWVGTAGDLAAVIESDDYLKEHAFIIREAASKARYMLDANVEEALAQMAVNASSAWSMLRGQIEATLTGDVVINGESQTLPLPMLRNLAMDSDAAVRKAAYEAELECYQKVELPVSYCLNSIKGESLTVCAMRGYESPLAQIVENSRCDMQTLTSMLNAMEEALPAFWDYLKAKAKLLGHKGGLPFYDMFAPVAESDMRYTYEESRKFLVDNFRSFSDELADFVDNAFQNRWIDAEPREGKRGGAFCANLHPIRQSRVLANFDGSFNNVLTLAHELGHAYHGHCLNDVSILNADYPMPLAETASIFNETLIAELAIKQAGEDERFALIEHQLQNATQIIVDIFSRYLFETHVFNVRADHGLSVEELKEAMLSAQKKAYGDGLDHDWLHPYMWICKTHYYFPENHFYNWPYAFGLLFGMGVYARYDERGKAFIPEYKELLAATGSATIADVAARAAIDVRDIEFWRKSLGTIKKNIELFCEMAEKRSK